MITKKLSKMIQRKLPEINEVRKYIGNLIYKLPIYSESRIIGNKMQTLVVFHPDTPKSEVIEMKHFIVNYLENCFVDYDYITKKTVIGERYIVFHGIKSKKVNGNRVKITYLGIQNKY